MSNVVFALDREGIEDVMLRNTWRPYERTGVPAVYSATHGHSVRWPVTRSGMSTNALLSQEEWQETDAAVVKAYHKPLVGIADLISRGLVQQKTLATQVLQYRALSPGDGPTLSMLGDANKEVSEGDSKFFSLPLPLGRVDYKINVRHLLASRRLGEGLDTEAAENAAESLAQVWETMLFKGSSIAIDGHQIYGYTNVPGAVRETATGFGGGSFSADPSNVQDTIMGMWKQLVDLNFLGPFGLYVDTGTYAQLAKHDRDGSGQTHLARLLTENTQFEFITQSSHLDQSTGEIVMVRLDEKSVNLVVALDTTNRQWLSNDMLTENYVVLASHIPNIRRDYRGYAAVAHAIQVR